MIETQDMKNGVGQVGDKRIRIKIVTYEDLINLEYVTVCHQLYIVETLTPVWTPIYINDNIIRSGTDEYKWVKTDVLETEEQYLEWRLMNE